MNPIQISRYLAVSALAAILSVSTGAGALAAGSHGDGHHGPAIGAPGKAADAARTIEIVMQDNNFEPESISVAKGETVRFIVVNRGEFVHEFNIGTAAMHADHQKEMMTMVEHGVLEADKINHDMMKMDMGGGRTMEHNDPNSTLLEPGKTAEIVWTFSADADLEFACNVPGHYESGMVGKFEMRHGS
jgi:uncharacterized cupredoxin-like copper-binding protein